MIKNLLYLGIACLMAVNSPLQAQKISDGIYYPNEKKAKSHVLKTDVFGSYPQHMEESLWLQDAWMPYATEDVKYRNDGWITEIVRSDPEGKIRETFTYNDDGWETGILTEIWLENAWVNQKREIENFNDDGEYLGYTLEKWTDNAWELDEGMLFEYHKVNGKTDVMIIQIKRQGEDWVNMQRYTYTYFEDADVVSSVIIEGWENDEWVITMKIDYTVEDDVVVEEVYSHINDGEWVVTNKMTTTYGENGSIVFTNYSWLNGAWVPSGRTTYEYDALENQTLYMVEFYNNGWAPAFGTQYLLTYNGDNLTQRIEQSFGQNEPGNMKTFNTITWTNVKKQVYSDFNTAGVPVISDDEISISSYPNPVSDLLIIKVKNPVGEKSIILNIYSISGQLAYTGSYMLNSGAGIITIPVSSLDSGSYFVRIQDKKGNSLHSEMILIQ